MEAGIETFTNNIIERTGVKLAVFDTEGNFIAGEQFTGETVEREFGDVFTDVVKRRTLFKIKYKNNDYIMRLAGASIIERNYAYLIAELAENVPAKESYSSKEEFLRAVIFGNANHNQIDRHAKKLGVKQNYAYVMQILVAADKSDDLENILYNYCGNKDVFINIDNGVYAYIKFFASLDEENCSPVEYAEVLAQSVYEETGKEVRVGVGGTVEQIEKLSQSYIQAVSANRLSESYGIKGNVHAYRDFIYFMILEDLPAHKINEYLDLLIDGNAKEIFDDEEMVVTAEEFLENNLNVSETSRKLFLHRNTLMYRLDKIERSTGLDLRNFSDALTFKMTAMLVRQAKRK